MQYKMPEYNRQQTQGKDGRRPIGVMSLNAVEDGDDRDHDGNPKEYKIEYMGSHETQPHIGEQTESNAGDYTVNSAKCACHGSNSVDALHIPGIPQ